MKSTQKALELARFACEEPFCLIESKTCPHDSPVELQGGTLVQQGAELEIRNINP
jgi:hypothetical protein